MRSEQPRLVNELSKEIWIRLQAQGRTEDYHQVKRRIRIGWNVEHAITTPVQKKLPKETEYLRTESLVRSSALGYKNEPYYEGEIPMEFIYTYDQLSPDEKEIYNNL